MLGHSAHEVIGQRLQPAHARIRAVEGDEHLLLGAETTRGEQTLDRQRLDPLDHDAAAHLHRRSYADPVGDGGRVHSEPLQRLRQLPSPSASQQHRNLQSLRRHGSHDGRLDVISARGFDQRRLLTLGCRRHGIDIQEYLAGANGMRRLRGDGRRRARRDRRNHQRRALDSRGLRVGDLGLRCARLRLQGSSRARGIEQDVVRHDVPPLCRQVRAQNRAGLAEADDGDALNVSHE